MIIKLKDFFEKSLNGVYIISGMRNNKPYYKNNNGVCIVYHEEYGPYSFSPGYYIIKNYKTHNSIPIEKPFYKMDGYNIPVGKWGSLLSKGSINGSFGSIEQL